jgi:hypothetical protein
MSAPIVTAEQLRAFRAAVKARRACGPGSREFIEVMNTCYDAFGITDDCCDEHGDVWCYDATRPIALGVLDFAKGVTTPRSIRRWSEQP